ncbi:MAG TPA: hypothetical protein VNN10_07615 [Dehalococcoidia bacterium]|nr:hypothetical protein [Dehalococcoidia bacterium]
MAAISPSMRRRRSLTSGRRPRLTRVPLPGFRAHLFMLGVAFGAVEGLLGLRLWAQFSGNDVTAPLLGALYDLSSAFIDPFRDAETTAPVRDHGLLELATLLALEVYFVAGLLLVVALVLLRMARRTLLRRSVAGSSPN